MPRVPLVPSDSDDADLAEIFDVFRNSDRDVPDLYRVLGNAPKLLKAWTDFAWPLRHESTTPRGLRELAILRVAQITGADFEWKAHSAFALKTGATQQQLDELAEWPTSSSFSEDERGLLAFADQLTTNLHVDDDVFATLQQRWGPAELVELTLTVAFYSCVSRVLNGLQIH
jgi:4-carboxymuconolactone decarboxylase